MNEYNRPAGPQRSVETLKDIQLEPAVQTLISATNSGDGDALLRAFAPDAVLVDFGRTFRGHAQIAKWDRQENTGTQNHLRVRAVDPGPPMRLSLSVSGNGYNGEGVFEIELTDGLISHLTIT
jgi:ketosteroid isomerase-like protein